MEKIAECLVLTACGVFVLIACVKDWNWFFDNRKAQPFVKIFGRNGARIFYGIIGAFVLFCAFMVMFTE